MKLKYFVAVLSLTIAPVLAAAQDAHQGHDQATKHGSHAMPALNDEHFLAMMIKHHQDGIELAKLEESKGSREPVKTLAAKIRAGQERELSEMKAHEGKHAGHAATRGTSGSAAD